MAVEPAVRASQPGGFSGSALRADFPVFENLTAYKNRNGGIWGRGEMHVFKNVKLADNAMGYTHASGSAGRDPFTSKVVDSLFVGETENIGNPRTDAEKAYGRSLPKPQLPDFPIRGYEYYDYRHDVENVTFRNYEEHRLPGLVDLKEAMAFSCNTTYMPLSIMVYEKDPTALTDLVRDFGFGQLTGMRYLAHGRGIKPLEMKPRGALPAQTRLHVARFRIVQAEFEEPALPKTRICGSELPQFLDPAIVHQTACAHEIQAWPWLATAALIRQVTGRRPGCFTAHGTAFD